MGLFKSLERLGRLGGVILLGMSLAIVAFGVFTWRHLFPEEATHWSPVGTAIGIGIFLVAGMVLLAGIAMMVRKPIARINKLAIGKTVAGEYLQDILTSAARPYYFCVPCRAIFSRIECYGPCPRCGTQAECLKVENDSDLRLALASVADLPKKEMG